MTMEDDNSVYVGGLPYDCIEDTVRKTFDLYGTVVAVKILNDRDVGGKCYGFVTFINPRSAIDAINDMNGRTIGGRVVRVNEVRTRAGRSNFTRGNPRREGNRGMDFERDRDRDRDRDRVHDHDRERYWERSSGRSRDHDQEWEMDEERPRSYDQSRGNLLEWDQDESRDRDHKEQDGSWKHNRDHNEQEGTRKHERDHNEQEVTRRHDHDWSRNCDHDLERDHGREMDGADDHDRRDRVKDQQAKSQSR